MRNANASSTLEVKDADEFGGNTNVLPLYFVHLSLKMTRIEITILRHEHENIGWSIDAIVNRYLIGA